MIYHNNYLAVMRRFTLINKSYIAPQIRAGRNNVVKQSTVAGEPIPLSSYFKYGDQLTPSSDGKYIVIGENIKVVRITGQLHFSLNDTKCGLAIRVLKTDGVVQMVGCSYGDGTTYTSNLIVVLEVEKGDQIYIATTSDSVINPSNGGGFRSYLIVEKIA